MAKKSNRNITEKDRAAAARLSDLWYSAKEQRKFTQETAADELGWTQGAISQYINGDLALGIKATLKFAQFLGCHPTDIRDDLEELGLDPGDLSPDAIALALHWQERLPPDAKEAVRRMIFSYPCKDPPETPAAAVAAS
jgi:transcriptional regulator with XRE-family HTH domain